MIQSCSIQSSYWFISLVSSLFVFLICLFIVVVLVDLSGWKLHGVLQGPTKSHIAVGHYTSAQAMSRCYC